MILDLANIRASVKEQLTNAKEKADGKRLNRAINNCLDDLSTRLVTKGMLTSYEDTLTAGTRTYTILGDAQDLRYLFALKYGSGALQLPLDYIDPDQFIKKHDDPSASAGVPRFYTIMDNDGGDPVIKFNVPTLNSDTLVIFYAIDYSSNNIDKLRSGSAVIAGTLAWFWGISDGDRGERSYGIYIGLVALMRASDHFMIRPKKRLGINAFDRSVRTANNVFRNNRG